MAKKLNKLVKVSDSFTINRYDNGFMIEIQGKTKDDDWKTSKVLCASEAELFEVVKEAITMELDN